MSLLRQWLVGFSRKRVYSPLSVSGLNHYSLGCCSVSDSQRCATCAIYICTVVAVLSASQACQHWDIAHARCPSTVSVQYCPSVTHLKKNFLRKMVWKFLALCDFLMLSHLLTWAIEWVGIGTCILESISASRRVRSYVTFILSCPAGFC